MTRFSILVPAYNRERYIRQAVDSVLSQTFTDYELFVIDDGSTDKTVSILESYGPRLKLLRQSNQGPEVARNKAAALAQGEYLVLLDSDDLLLPSALATYDKVIRHFDSPPLILGAMTEFQDGQPVLTSAPASTPVKVLKFQDYLSINVKGLRVSSSRIAVRKSTFQQVGGLRNTSAKNFHLDSLNLMLKVATYGPCIVVQEPDTVAYRHHEMNTIHSLEAITNGILVLARSERDGEYPGGNERRFQRRASIGAMAVSWSIRELLRQRQAKLAVRLLSQTAPMAAMAVWNRVFHYRHKPVVPIVLDQA
jgi:glycosyltransferase involved in cell wall biosynthesis